MTHKVYKEKKPWSKEEDAELQKAVEAFGTGNWGAVSQMVSGRTPTQCSQHWHKVLDPSLIKGFWTSEEDALLVKLKTQSPEIRWKEVSKQIPTRSAKQCRERWTNSLDPSLKRGKFSVEEDTILVETWKKYGPCWNLIATQLAGRNQTKVRDRFKTVWSHKQVELGMWASAHKQQWQDAADKRREMRAVKAENKKKKKPVAPKPKLIPQTCKSKQQQKLIEAPSFVPLEMLAHLKTFRTSGEFHASDMSVPSIIKPVSDEMSLLTVIGGKRKGSNSFMLSRNARVVPSDDAGMNKKSRACFSPDSGAASHWRSDETKMADWNTFSNTEFLSSPESLVLDETDLLYDLPDFMLL